MINGYQWRENVNLTFVNQVGVGKDSWEEEPFMDRQTGMGRYLARRSDYHQDF